MMQSESLMDRWTACKHHQTPVNEALLQLVTDAVQSQQRLLSELKRLKRTPAVTDQPAWIATEQTVEECSSMAASLCGLRSEIEGTTRPTNRMSVSSQHAYAIRQLLLMHTENSLNDETRKTLLQHVHAAFQGQWVRLLYAAVLFCPWYVSVQNERGVQAKHNKLFLVYVASDEQIFAPVNPSAKEQACDTFEHEGWLYASEVYHFAHHLVAGKVRFVESMYAPSAAILYMDDCWQQLLLLTTGCNVIGLQSFSDQCRGQAVGSVGRKQKKGKFVMRDVVTLHDFCESFRLMQHASSVVAQSPAINLSSALVKDKLSDPYALEAFQKLHSTYGAEVADQDGGQLGSNTNQLELFEILMRWKEALDQSAVGFVFSSVERAQKEIGDWLMRVRMEGRSPINALPLPSNEDAAKRDALLAQIGADVTARVPHECILLIARAGSHLYGLSTPQSDADYIIVYAEPTQRILSSTSRPTESRESRGPEKAVEYGVYEVRLFTEMLHKGSVIMLELLFADSLDYCSSAWKELAAHRELFVTEHAAQQYFGLIKNNLAVVASGKHRNLSRESKLFYQIFHKLYCLEFFLRESCPDIRCSGETRNFIMKVRQGYKDDGELSRDALHTRAQRDLDTLRTTFNARPFRLPENICSDFLLQWILHIRGL